jgi:hypothetical protein
MPQTTILEGSACPRFVKTKETYRAMGKSSVSQGQELIEHWSVPAKAVRSGSRGLKTDGRGICSRCSQIPGPLRSL